MPSPKTTAGSAHADQPQFRLQPSPSTVKVSPANIGIAPGPGDAGIGAGLIQTTVVDITFGFTKLIFLRLGLAVRIGDDGAPSTDP